MRRALASLGDLGWELVSRIHFGALNPSTLMAESAALAVLTTGQRLREAARPGRDGRRGDRMTMESPDIQPADADSRQVAAARTSDRPYLWLPTLVAIGLLFFLVGPLGREIREPISSTERVLTYAGLLLFAAIYLWAIPGDLAGHHGRILPAVVVLAALAVGISFLDSRGIWTVLFIATAAGAGRIQPSRSALISIAVTTALTAFTLVALPSDSFRTQESVRILKSSLEVALAGLVVLGFSQLERTARELQAAEAEVARAATEIERARIARDLHDLLGHSLSLVALKTELARRLIDRDPPRASEELADVEEIVRTSLRDVRQAVAGYRQVDLETELSGARVALVAAGFDVLIERPEERLEPSQDALLGWVVREGVTNVVRHSQGSQCSIEVEAAGDGVRLQILDDGQDSTIGIAPRASVGTGRGLRGVAERVAQAGGSVEAGWRATGGYALTVTLPAPPTPAVVA